MDNRNQLYGRQWRKARKAHLLANPLCVMCEAEGRITRATVVHHSVKHNGNPKVFWDQSIWQSVCQPHHDITAQRQEKTGLLTGVDAQGRPTHPDHPWNKER